jgi:glycosyltransferase involved in cell wall biosynthesis
MRVLHMQYTNPGAYPPLVRGAALLADAGADVLMLGTRVTGLDALDAPPMEGVDVRLVPPAADGWRLKAHYARYAAWVAREGAAWKPDWIYASDLLAAPIALALGALTGARIVYHEHDAPSLEHPSWTIRQCLAARRRLIQQADLIVTPNAERSAAIARLGGRHVITAWNCPRRPPGAAPAHRERGALRVVYRGSINRERLPLSVVDALAAAGSDVTMTIAGYETVGSRGYVAEIEARARALGIADRVRVLGTVPDARLAAICAQSHVGLALMPVDSLDENMRHMTGASNKVFEYWSDGVVPLVSDLPDWRATFVDPGYALACHPRQVDSIAQMLRWAADRRDDLLTIATRAWDRLHTDWNYETQFAPVMAAMTGGATRTPSASAVTPTETACVS